MIDSTANGFRLIVEGTRTGELLAAGYETGLIFLQNNAVLDINFRANKNCVLEIYSSPCPNVAQRQLFFSKTIALATTFHRRFAMISQHIQIKITNSDGVVGNFLLITHASQNTQFNASTFLNSNIEIDANTNLTRVGNDYNLDMVRGIHEDFSKVNIQGITDQQHAAEYTIGNGSTDCFANDNIAEALYVLTINTQDRSGGTGARYVKITYIDSNYDEQTLTKQLGWVAGSQPLGVNGFAVSRVEVTSTGSSLKNLGIITITDILSAKIYATIDAEANVSHTANYLIPRNKHLILSDVSISAVGFPATIRLYEYDFAVSKIRGSIGDFRLSTNYNQIVYKLNGKIDEKKMILVNVIPDAGAPATNTLVNVNINGILCPAINNF